METGQYIMDGTVRWIVADIRDGHEVGEVIFCDHLKDGYIKANGATVTASDYPRLTAYVVANNLTGNDDAHYQYDSENDVLTLPNVMDRIIQGGNAVEAKEAGLPNIRGAVKALSTDTTGNASGAFAQTSISSQKDYRSTETRYLHIASFDASRSSSVYGNSGTVQPPAIVMIPQIKY